MDRILNMSLLPLTALSKLTADRSPRFARRWAQLTARRSDVRCSPLDGSTAHGSPHAARQVRIPRLAPLARDDEGSLRSLGMTARPSGNRRRAAP